MQHLRANTQVIVTVGPFVDVGDGFTPQTDITLGGDEAELLKHGATAVVSIAAATWAAVTSCRGYYSLTLTTSHTDTEGMLVVVVQDDSDCLPVKQEFMVLSEAAWDSLYAAKDTGFMDVNVAEVSDDATAADNLELACDNYSATRGLTGTALPAAAAEAAGGLYTRGTGAGQIDQLGNGQCSVGVVAMASSTIGTGTFSVGAINAAAIATDAITALKIATSAVDEIVDQVWDELQSGHTTAGSMGVIASEIASILLDTDELQGDWVNGGRLDLILDTLALEATVAALNDLSAAAVNAEVDTALVDIGLDHLLSVAVLGADVTDNSIFARLVSASATADWDTFTNATDALEALRNALALEATVAALNDLSTAQVNAECDTAISDAALATAANLAVVDANVDQIEAAVITNAVGADVSADIVTLQADTDDIQARVPAALVGGRMDANMSAIAGSSDSATNLDASAEVIVLGTVDTVTNTHTPTITEFQCDDITEATADHFIGRTVIFRTGACQWQATDITDYALVGGIAQFTVTAMTDAPANNDTVVIL